MTTSNALVPAGPVIEILSKTCPDCGEAMTVPVVEGPWCLGKDIDVYCDACVDTRLRAEEREARRVRLRNRFERLVRRGWVGPEVRETAFRNSNVLVEALNPEAWDKARKWRGLRNLYVHGPTGVGKSYLARCCLNWAFQQGLSVAEVSGRRFAKVSDTFAEGRGLFHAWKEAGVLLLDDVDKAAWTGDRIGALWELLDARNARRRRTLVTGNVSPSELVELMREHVAGRGLCNDAMVEATLERLRPCDTHALVGESLRGR